MALCFPERIDRLCERFGALQLEKVDFFIKIKGSTLTGVLLMLYN